jgi:dGTPase
MKEKWRDLLIEDRLHRDASGLSRKPCDQADMPRSVFAADTDRIMFSSSFRRLAKKTQVHPLALNDHIHNRLTHSLEVSSVGRSLGATIGSHLQTEGLLPDRIQAHNIGEIVQAACLAHDIGNPPFGHAGEAALQNWFKDPVHSRYIEPLTASQKSDFVNFDGNAQNFRILTVLEYYHRCGGMRLTYPSLASMVKYPITSHRAEEHEKVKFGFYESEKDIFLHIAQTLKLGDEINHIRRYPFSYLSEAADDICYSIIDLEDAQEMKILTVDEIFEIIGDAFGGKKIDEIVEDNRQSDRRKVSYLRTKVIGILIDDISTAFKDNINNILNDKLDGDLILYSSERVKKIIKNAKNIARDKIFKEIRKVTLEIGAYTIFEKLLDIFIPAIYERVYRGSENDTFKTTRVIDLLGVNAPKDTDDLYASYQSVVDFVSGMTDDYATFISSQFSGAGR